MIIELLLVALFITCFILAILGKLKQFATAKGLLLLWSAMFLVYAILVSFLALGPTDFDGKPNPVIMQVLGYALLFASLAQVVFATRLFIYETRQLLRILLGTAALLLAIFIGATGFIGIATGFPASLNLLVLAIFVGYRLNKFSETEAKKPSHK